MGNSIWIDNNHQWQVRIWIDSKKTEKPTVLYGETIAEVKTAVSKHILDTNPQKSLRSTNKTYIYSDGSIFLPELPIIKERRIRQGKEQEPAEEGWHICTQSNIIQDKIDSIQEVIQSLLKTPEFIEKGPRYQDPTIVDGVFLLAMIKTTKRLYEADSINAALQRGWHLLKIDEGNTYHLGHEDPDAI